MKLIFLDFDGVLNSPSYLRRNPEGIGLDPDRLFLLSQVVKKTGAKIVLTTSWREHWDADPNRCDEVGREINEIFRSHGMEIFQKTPEGLFRREDEILAFLESREDVERFAVLDDAFLEADFLRGHFIRTTPTRGGLGEEEAMALLSLLGDQTEEKTGEKTLFVVSDVHGHLTLLKEALEKAGFEKENPDHLLICCGDYFDRGTENLGVLKFFERAKNKVLLRGNHEDLFKKLLLTGQIKSHHYVNGTLQTVKEFFGKYAVDPATDVIDFSGQSRMVDRVMEFIEETVDYFETEHYVFVHGWIPSSDDTPEGRQNISADEWADARWMRWTEQYTGQRPLKEKTLVCGHVPTVAARLIDPTRPPSCYEPYEGNGLLAIDAGTYDSQTVNVLVLKDRLLGK